MSGPSQRTIRYQGAIVRGHELLLIYYQPHDAPGWWMLPGGGRERETEAECVAREMREETHLEVRVECLLYDLPAPGNDEYRRLRTYLCTPVSGTERPGAEPGDTKGEIARVGWFDLRDASRWPEAIRNDPITYPQLLAVREALAPAPEQDPVARLRGERVRAWKSRNAVPD